MRAALLALAFFALQAADTSTEVDAAPQRFAITRAIDVPADANGQVCVTLDAPVYAHTEGRLTGLRIYSSTSERPLRVRSLSPSPNPAKPTRPKSPRASRTSAPWAASSCSI